MGVPDIADAIPQPLPDLTETLESAAIAAGREILAVRAAGAKISIKSDSTPVTQADRSAEALVLERLTAQFPAVPIVAEEMAEDGKCPSCAQASYFLVDALDGTGEFIAGRNEFTVNIALIRDFKPVAGVVYAPALGRIWTGAGRQARVADVTPEGEIVERKIIQTRKRPKTPVALVSLSHREPETQAWIDDRIPDHETTHVGSSLKFCLLAEGKADVYPRLVCLKQWDIAAGDAVLRAAGGVTLGLDGEPLKYGVDNSDFGCGRFICWGEAPEPVTTEPAPV
ncbi:3''(2''),5''-bisphosphate nucleotidase, bacterial [Hoeflea phototrophica DFL-43]|uniref:3'(2'),5'-bisphosphate nucleotidase CysQ n=1 Tax=Hoeflea phototrophica (strain DSM 17068 / NCIMB 14078 / DFL-43) TaxID=411684 RepID=A9DAD4_HOEPD|nr:3'(2'),5'-bisphosphate nucleotidase CysQ [Hoeflea phototrophica]EDQ32713.1 3''(2''),5''-bisphosphate nucleotidase, bacterial [Hoeflea phototrophica DFL-43]